MPKAKGNWTHPIVYKRRMVGGVRRPKQPMLLRNLTDKSIILFKIATTYKNRHYRDMHIQYLIAYTYSLFIHMNIHILVVMQIHILLLQPSTVLSMKQWKLGFVWFEWSTCGVTCDRCLTAAGRQPAELERALRGHRPSVPGGEPMTSLAVVMPFEWFFGQDCKEEVVAV